MITLRALNRATLARQLLLERTKVSPVAAVEQLAGMQAQLARPPYIGLWSRIDGFRREMLTDAARKRELVRGTWIRGTLHLLSRKDYLAFRPAIQPLLSRMAEGILKGRDAEGLDAEELVREARAFFDEEPGTFDELRKHLVKLHPKANDRAMGYLVRTELPLLQVPADDATWGWPASADFAVAETWLGAKLARNSKVETLALRYLAAFGPATASDFQTWSGMQNGKAIFESIRKKVVVFKDDKSRELFDLPDAPRPSEDTPAPVRFLPDFDNLLLAHADRRRIIPDEHRKKIVPSANLRVLPTFLVDGSVAGTWSVEKKKLQLEPFGKLTKAVRREVDEEGERLLAFLG
jgi:hypothetical protein